MYIYKRLGWPDFTWQHAQLGPLLGALRHQQGRVLEHMGRWGSGCRPRPLQAVPGAGVGAGAL